MDEEEKCPYCDHVTDDVIEAIRHVSKEHPQVGL